MKREDYLGLKIGLIGCLLFAFGALLAIYVHMGVGVVFMVGGFVTVLIGFALHALIVVDRFGRR